jgi:hypothetical protein
LSEVVIRPGDSRRPEHALTSSIGKLNDGPEEPPSGSHVAFDWHLLPFLRALRTTTRVQPSHDRRLSKTQNLADPTMWDLVPRACRVDRVPAKAEERHHTARIEHFVGISADVALRDVRTRGVVVRQRHGH